jgi:hypothetical protein
MVYSDTLTSAIDAYEQAPHYADESDDNYDYEAGSDLEDSVDSLIGSATLKMILDSLEDVQRSSGLEDAYSLQDDSVLSSALDYEDDFAMFEHVSSDDYTPPYISEAVLDNKTYSELAQEVEVEIYSRAESVQATAREHQLQGKIYMDVGYELRDARNAVFCMSPAMWMFIYDNIGKMSFSGL